MITVGVLTGILLAPMALAQTASPTVTKTQRLAQLEQDRITNLKNRADTEITRRITSLSSLVTRLGNMKHLTAAQIASFTNEVNAEISNLTTLKTKIDADTDLTTLKADVKSIVSSYRVYALFLPQINILAAADRALTIVAEFSALETKLQTRIQEVQAAGKDVTSLQTTLTDMQSKITDATNQAQSIISMVTPLTPDGYPGNRTTLQSARGAFKTIYADFVAARKDAKTIMQALMNKSEETSPTPSLTPAPTK